LRSMNISENARLFVWMRAAAALMESIGRSSEAIRFTVKISPGAGRKLRPSRDALDQRPSASAPADGWAEGQIDGYLRPVKRLILRWPPMKYEKWKKKPFHYACFLSTLEPEEVIRQLNLPLHTIACRLFDAAARTEGSRARFLRRRCKLSGKP
jgi:hypothetical protein